MAHYIPVGWTLVSHVRTGKISETKNLVQNISTLSLSESAAQQTSWTVANEYWLNIPQRKNDVDWKFTRRLVATK